jgi:hypothetical protein
MSSLAARARSVLTDRRAESAALDRLLDAVRTGESRVLVVLGAPGPGKTALLEYLAGQAAGGRVAHAAGMKSEMELAFAGLHQLCAPLLDWLETLAVPQRDAARATPQIKSAGAASRRRRPSPRRKKPLCPPLPSARRTAPASRSTTRTTAPASPWC